MNPATQRLIDLEAQLRSMTLAFRRVYTDHNPQHTEPSAAYISSILSGSKDLSNKAALEKSSKRRTRLEAERMEMMKHIPTQVKSIDTGEAT